jgi:hypothetical protein
MRVVRSMRDTPDGTEADACWTTERGVACTIMVADCLPVLLADTAGRLRRAAHAAGAGLAGIAGHGVLEALWAASGRRSARRRDDAARTPGWAPASGRRLRGGREVKAAFEATTRIGAGALSCCKRRQVAGRPAGAGARPAGALGIGACTATTAATAWCTVAIRHGSFRTGATASAAVSPPPSGWAEAAASCSASRGRGLPACARGCP